MFNKNDVFQHKLAVVLAETRELHLGKMRERKASKILRAASARDINRSISSRSIGSSSRSSTNNSRSSIVSSSSNINVARLAIILIILNYGRKTRVVLEIFEYSEGRQIS